MLYIPTTDLRQRIAQECREYTTPQFPQFVRSMQILVPHLDFFRIEFFSWWRGYCRTRGLVNFNDSYCDLIAGVAVAEMNWCAGHHAAATRQDCTAALFEARIDIHTAPFLNIVHGKHSTCLFAYTVNGHEYDLAFWEPQNLREFIYAPIHSALERVDLYDVLL